MKVVKSTACLLAIGFFNSCGVQKQETIQEQASKVENSAKIENPTNKVLLSSEIVWEKLNPARGDKSPQAGTLWGDRIRGASNTGFLAKFIDGFSSPPHIHNVTYRAVVIKGMIHNDDPAAEDMWMQPGSFWTQPAGLPHITAAKGEECMALVEISKGPYLVQPTDEAFDKNEKPINIDASNIIWLDRNKTNWIETEYQAEISFLSGQVSDGEMKSIFVKLPEKYNGIIETDGTVVHAVVIKGELNYTMPQNGDVKTLDIGSYFGSTEKAVHTVSNRSDSETIVYIRTNGKIKVK